MAVGQAHLLDDVISLVCPPRRLPQISHSLSKQLELDPPEGPGVFQRMTLTYALGDQHGLFEALRPSEEASENSE